MEGSGNRVALLSQFVHEHFLGLLAISYTVAALFPSLGLRIRDVSFGEVACFGENTQLTLPVLMLAFLLLNAGLGVQTSSLRHLARGPLNLLAGLVANLVIPVAFIFGVSELLELWHNPTRCKTFWSAWRWSPPCRLPVPLPLGPRTPTATWP